MLTLSALHDSHAPILIIIYQEIMDEVFHCPWELSQSAHDYRVALKALTFNAVDSILVADVRFDLDAIIFRNCVLTESMRRRAPNVLCLGR